MFALRSPPTLHPRPRPIYFCKGGFVHVTARYGQEHRPLLPTPLCQTKQLHMSTKSFFLLAALFSAVFFFTRAHEAPQTTPTMATSMTENYGFLVVVTAKPGKADALGDFLRSALPLAQDEPGTQRWYAFQIDERRYGIFDTFADEAGRQAHYNGKIAAALLANADELLEGFDAGTDIHTIDILATK